MNTVAFAEDALRTARHTVRLIRTHPGFVLTVVLSLALGIGANTTIFSVVHGALIQPLPYPRADALVGVHTARPRLFRSPFPRRRRPGGLPSLHEITLGPAVVAFALRPPAFGF